MYELKGEHELFNKWKSNWWENLVYFFNLMKYIIKITVCNVITNTLIVAMNTEGIA